LSSDCNRQTVLLPYIPRETEPVGA